MSSDFGDIGNTVADAASGGMTAGLRGAKAAGDAAKANLAQQQSDRAAARSLAEPTPDELKQLNQSISLNEQDIARKQKLLDSADPALIEAGTQALQLLRGQDAKTLAPLRSQFDQEESALRSKLSAQLGPGYENSTAGIQALQAFNQQKNSVMANAQQNALGALLGVAQNTEQIGSLQNNIGNSQNLANLFGNIQKREISAIQGTPITDSGAPFVEDAGRAAAGTAFVNRGIQLASAVASGGASLAAPGGVPGTGGGTGVPMTGGAGNSPLGNTQIDTSQYGKYY